MNKKKTVLIFGATGAIGKALADWFSAHDWKVIGVQRTLATEKSDTASPVEWVFWNPQLNKKTPSEIHDPVDAIVWAQGLNCNDSIYSFDSQRHAEVYYANVTYILNTLSTLLSDSLLADSCRLAIISSIWQEIARQEKLSYMITKSALKGLVQSLTVDLGKKGFLVNAVLPGALDTPMTKANLSEKQISNLENSTPLGCLATLDDVCNLTGFLCSSDNTGITGQFIVADRGFSYAKII
ncbi:MAG: SDR family oxidoreductase [Chlorobium sp.]|nr:SDR family oxidoreductase [Chlorobium sp.]